MELVILAAGIGSRFGGLKQIEPMDDYGNFIIDYSIYDAIEAGFDCVTFIIKKELFTEFRNTIGKRIETKIKTKYAFQELTDLPQGFTCPSNRIKPWGTAHAIYSAKDVIEDNFVIINADDYYGKDSFKVAAKYLSSLKETDNGKYANVVYSVDKTLTENGSVKRGVCFGKNGMLENMIESSIQKVDGKIIATPVDTSIKPFEIDESQPVSMNMFVFTKEVLNHLQDKFSTFINSNKDKLDTIEFLIPTVVSELIQEGKASVQLMPTTAKWYGVTYHDDKETVVKALNELVLNNEYKVGLWK